MVGQDLHGVTVLDAFGGSGLLGLEAWSRGADVTIVERDRGAWRAIQANVAALGADTVAVVRGDVRRWVGEAPPFELVLADPPYDDAPEPILEVLAPAVGGRLVFEVDAQRPDPGVPALRLVQRKKYGGTSLCVFETAEAAHE